MRRYVLLALVASGLLVALSTGGFSATSVDRFTSVSVADDRAAYLGVEVEDPELTNPDAPVTSTGSAPPSHFHEEVALLTLTNQFDSSVTLQVRADVEGDPEGGPEIRGDLAAPSDLRAGETGAVTADVQCPPGRASMPASETVTVTLVAGDDAVDVDLTREVTVTCTWADGGDRDRPSPDSPTG